MFEILGDQNVGQSIDEDIAKEITKAQLDLVEIYAKTIKRKNDNKGKKDRYDPELAKIFKAVLGLVQEVYSDETLLRGDYEVDVK